MNNLTSIHKEWKEAKERAAQICDRAGLKDIADKYRQCTMFRGDEPLEELVELVFSPQGIELMTSFGFPNVNMFRRFVKYNLTDFGIYVDAGQITIEEEQRVLLVGNTHAILKYYTTHANNVCALYGATARIEAAGYSVVKIDKDKQSKVWTEVTDHAIVL